LSRPLLGPPTGGQPPVFPPLGRHPQTPLLFSRPCSPLVFGEPFRRPAPFLHFFLAKHSWATPLISFLDVSLTLLPWSFSPCERFFAIFSVPVPAWRPMSGSATSLFFFGVSRPPPPFLSFPLLRMHGVPSFSLDIVFFPRSPRFL